MENNLENKSKFFALYWGFKCLRNELLNDNIPAHKVDTSNCKGLPQQYLELKPLSQISDEDKIHICSLLGIANYKDAYGFEDLFVSVNNNIQSYLSDDSIDFTLECYDYLRSRGYALPWMGLSVEQLVEYGWVKLKKD